MTRLEFWQGTTACAEGALAAGCTFFGGYPITPSTEVAEHMAAKLPKKGGVFIQMEDEIASMASISGASWAGGAITVLHFDAYFDSEEKARSAETTEAFRQSIENVRNVVMHYAACAV